MTNQVDTETKLAFLEQAHEELNSVVLRQQGQIERLEALVESLRQYLRQMSEDGDNEVQSLTQHELPPHY